MKERFGPRGRAELAHAPEAAPPPSLTELDVKGREIRGLEPVPERFSRLEAGRDYQVLWENTEIQADQPAADSFIFVNHNGGEIVQTVEAPHWRVANGEINATYETPHGLEHYYEVNTKGVGYVKPVAKGRDLDAYPDWHRTDENGLIGAYGLVDKVDFDDADDGNIVDRTALFVSQGLRCELYRAVAKLENVYYRGELVSIADLRRRGVIPKSKSFTPYMGERLVKTNSRIQELTNNYGPRQQELHDRAISTYQREMADAGRETAANKEELDEEYLRSMSRNIAGILAFMHHQGYEHFMLHSANLTLAGELVDIGTMSHWSHIQDTILFNVFDTAEHYRGVRIGTAKDMRDAVYGLDSLLAADCFRVSERFKAGLKKDFFAAYDRKIQELKEPDELDQQLDDVRAMLEAIFDAVIIDNKRLANLKSHDISDWPI